MNRLSNISLFFFTALFTLSATGRITVENPTVFTAQAGQTTAVFMTLKNDGEEEVNLVMADSEISSRLELHGTQQGKMPTLNGIGIPARGQTELKRGGLHIMVFDLAGPLPPGDGLPLTLYFDNGQVIRTDATVVSR